MSFASIPKNMYLQRLHDVRLVPLLPLNLFPRGPVQVKVRGNNRFVHSTRGGFNKPDKIRSAFDH